MLIDGESMRDVTPAGRDVAFVFEQYSLYPLMTVFDNLAFPLRSPLRRVPEGRIRDRVETTAEKLRITQLLDRTTANLSGGEMQRVSLGRALVRNPQIYLMDEPLSNLDAKLRASVRKDIKKLQIDLGITVVYVTHDQTEAMSMADMVVLMKDGHIQQTGTPEELYYKPANTFVAEFVGAPPMALIEGSALPGFGEAARIGLRAENVEVAEAGTGRMTCKVSECEFLGSETFIGLSHPGASGLTVSLPGLRNIAAGEEMEISFSDNDLHFFDSAGQRLAQQAG